MKIQEKLELLEGIRKVEAPPYLFTRIESKIRNEAEGKISSKNVAVLGMGLLVLLLVNISIISNNMNFKKSQTSVAQSFGLVTNNSFYHD